MKKNDDCMNIKVDILDLRNTSFLSQETIEQELDFLKNQADAISEQLLQIENRIHDLESEKRKDMM